MSSTTSTPQRDAKGRFLPGNTEGVGNPFGRRVASFRAILVQSVTEDEIANVFRQLLLLAMKGNFKAM